VFKRLLRERASSGISIDSIRLAPVKPSIFFDPVNGDRLAQWRAVIHEYLAILWYWWKDWI